MPVGTVGQREGARPGRPRGHRRADHPRQHLPPDAAARGRAGRARSAACTASWAGRARSSPTRAASRSSASRGRRKLDRGGRARSSRTSTARRSRLTPERAIAIQALLGSDIAMAFDECPPADAPTARYLEDVAGAHHPLGAALQGRLAPRRPVGALRDRAGRAAPRPAPAHRPRRSAPSTCRATRSAASASASRPRRCTRASRDCAPLLPAERPRYLMGVGTPDDLLARDRRGNRHVRLRDAHALCPQRTAVHHEGPRADPQPGLRRRSERPSTKAAAATPAGRSRAPTCGTSSSRRSSSPTASTPSTTSPTFSP